MFTSSWCRNTTAIVCHWKSAQKKMLQ